jgi:predicted ATPase
MELVYLWVEEYKNIRNQGFNFSPRFECEFDGENLTINENKDYVSIFPDNINITAIVGENGSGKSSVLVGITNHKAIFKIDNEYFCRGFEITKITAPITIKPIDENIGKYINEAIIYLDYDLIKINPIRDDWDYEGLNIYDKNLYKKIENASGWDSNFNIEHFREHFFNIIIEHIDSFNLKIFFYNPLKIFFSDYIHLLNSESKYEHINKLIKEVEEINFTKEKFLVFLYSNISMKVPPNIDNVNTVSDLLKIEDKILKKAEYLKLENIDEIYDFFEELNNQEILIQEFNKIYIKHKKAFLKLIEIGYLKINFKDSSNREYFDLSFGERKLFTEMLMIFNEIKESKNKDILIVLDEPDLTLHPDWQKKYINEMIKLLSNFPKKKFHLIITSHSPFILSDIPKENVIFLEKYKEDDEEVKNENQKVANCKNVTKDINIRTFGANIHTLLSNGFFMSDGLMGEFAKEKINEIKDFYNKNKDLKNEDSNFESKKDEFKKNKKYFENIQRIIGEPFLQTIIKNYLDELEILFNGKKEFLDKEIKRLEELRNEIK